MSSSSSVAAQPPAIVEEDKQPREKTREELIKENEDLRKMANGLAVYLLNLVPILEDAGKKIVGSGNAFFVIADNIRTISSKSPIAQQQQQQQNQSN